MTGEQLSLDLGMEEKEVKQYKEPWYKKKTTENIQGVSKEGLGLIFSGTGLEDAGTFLLLIGIFILSIPYLILFDLPMYIARKLLPSIIYQVVKYMSLSFITIYSIAVLTCIGIAGYKVLESIFITNNGIGFDLCILAVLLVFSMLIFAYQTYYIMQVFFYKGKKINFE